MLGVSGSSQVIKIYLRASWSIPSLCLSVRATVTLMAINYFYGQSIDFHISAHIRI